MSASDYETSGSRRKR